MMLGSERTGPLLRRWLGKPMQGLGLAGLFLLCTTWNWREVVVTVPGPEGLQRVVLYADGDCYARMTRVRAVEEGQGWFQRRHDFENAPPGIVPHTTALLDWLVVALAGGLRLAGVSGARDLAGAWVAPLLGLGAVLVLWVLAERTNLRPRWPLLLLFCLSPALTHVFAFGRPDHQALWGALVAVALALEWFPGRGGGPRFLVAGMLWGLALWVSWFEPLVLWLGLLAGRWWVQGRGAWRGWPGRAVLLTLTIALAAWLLEGARPLWPEAAVREVFPRWAAMLGELQSPGWFSGVLAGWTGWLLWGAPLLLAWSALREGNRQAAAGLGLLLLLWSLAAWQARWGGALALVFCLLLPGILAPLRRPWLQWTLFLVSLWPVAGAWELRLYPEGNAAASRSERVREGVLLHEAAQAVPHGAVVLAPWWITPALVYWSEGRGVAGTSHQSLPGTVDTARFFLAVDGSEARSLLQGRGVKVVVTDEPSRVVETSSRLLGVPVPPAASMAVLLARRHRAPDFLQLVFANPYYRVYEVRDADL